MPSMSTCPACRSEVPEASRFCLVCGASISLSAAPTQLGVSPSSTRGPSSASPPSGGRFVPGTMVGGRYRIVGLLGRGGMGEVYRADDLKLGQEVALKFLSQELAGDADRLERLATEVRLARQVSHPSVCRVYDIGEADGNHFISMEYVDGEDLASLLRRIGCLPGDKAVEIARQLASGLAAAHEKGVLHRDLKPANVMLDSRGRVRITDFGLAGLETELASDDVRAGTPAYMAPEQLAGKEVTSRSDLYSLGLVLYEVFTGRSAFKSDTLAGLAREQSEATPVTPSSFRQGIDPAAERVILRCLEKDPARRPRSALSVLAALPGGDPLAAALAAGETPSPEMVADAGEEGGLRPAVAWACLGTVVAGLVFLLATSGELRLVNRVPLEKPPDALADRARQVLRRVGHTQRPADTADGFHEDGDYLKFIRDNDKSLDRWERLESGRPPGITYWYRESPVPLIPKKTFAVVDPSDPAPLVAGMAMVGLDPAGRLGWLDVVPPEAQAADTPETPFDWTILFREAELDQSRFAPVEPKQVPPVFSDSRAAWEGSVADLPGVTVRIEAAAFAGRPVYFRILAPWSSPERSSPPIPGIQEKCFSWVSVGMMFSTLVASLFLARHNLRRGRSDRSGAFKIAVYFLVVHLVVWAIWASHVWTPEEEWRLFGEDTGWTLFNSVVLWLLYLALEPYVRRRWPDTIISWSRVLAGRLRDPLVGRDLLIGSVLGVIIAVISAGSILIPGWIGLLPPGPIDMGNETDLLGLGQAMAHFLDLHVHSIIKAMQFVLALVVLRALLRFQWLAALLVIAIFTVVVAGETYSPMVVLPAAILALGMSVYVVTRYGLLALTVGIFVLEHLNGGIITSDPSAWYFPQSVLVLFAALAPAVYGFHCALAGRPAFRLLGDEVLQE